MESNKPLLPSHIQSFRKWPCPETCLISYGLQRERANSFKITFENVSLSMVVQQLTHERAELGRYHHLRRLRKGFTYENPAPCDWLSGSAMLAPRPQDVKVLPLFPCFLPLVKKNKHFYLYIMILFYICL